ncbi:hypothetical protein AVEN_260125-1 [Araneus ventricosus]|uniref:Uncharacterized protein n=1 Tax=Araneus ventricosus TaxID=182803 RepID=A0A4Y2DI68_ARAVE|nr:hypothetical protein AVEN_260125-1 [Araneus ventricosus]
MKRLKGVLDGLRPGSSGYQSQKDKSEHHTTLDTAPDAPTTTDIDTVQEQLRPEHFKLTKVNPPRFLLTHTYTTVVSVLEFVSVGTSFNVLTGQTQWGHRQLFLVGHPKDKQMGVPLLSHLPHMLRKEGLSGVVKVT